MKLVQPLAGTSLVFLDGGNLHLLGVGLHQVRRKFALIFSAWRRPLFSRYLTFDPLPGCRGRNAESMLTQSHKKLPGQQSSETCGFWWKISPEMCGCRINKYGTTSCHPRIPVPQGRGKPVSVTYALEKNAVFNIWCLYYFSHKLDVRNEVFGDFKGNFENMKMYSYNY